MYLLVLRFCCDACTGAPSTVLPPIQTSSISTTLTTITTPRITPRVRQEIIKMGLGLEEIPAGSPEVQVLNVAYNRITTLPDFVFINNTYRNLKTILIHENKINTISTNAFRGLRLLKMVDISDNNISTIDPYTFKTNFRLQKLILVRNSVSFDRLQTFIISHSLETLILSNNRITQIHELTFMGVPNLKNLILNNNILTYVAPNSFKNLNKLYYLSLANTGVYRLSENMFGQLPRKVNLESTPLANRFDPPLEKITERGLENLIRIDKYLYWFRIVWSRRTNHGRFQNSFCLHAKIKGEKRQFIIYNTITYKLNKYV